MRKMMRLCKKKFFALICAILLIAAVLPACAEEGESAEEQGVQEIQQLLEVSEVENTEGMGLEELTEAFSEKTMSDYADGMTGFSMQYPSVFVFDEEKDSMTAYTEDRTASLSIESMQGGNLTEEILLGAIKLEVPDAEPQKYEQNNCLRVDRTAENGRCRTDLYLIAKNSFHHVTIEYPAEEQETYGPFIEYMINTMETKESEQG
jgi:hypothetical protein